LKKRADGNKTHRFSISAEELGKKDDGTVTGGCIEFQGNPVVLGEILARAMKEDSIQKMIHIALLSHLSGGMDNLLDAFKKFKKEMGNPINMNDKELEDLLKKHKGDPN